MFTNRLIWILEDDAGSRFVYEESLGLRFRLRAFDSLESFRTALHGDDERPELLIADLRLGDGMFLNCLSEEADRTRLNRFPFVVVSSTADLDALRFCFDRGASDYLTKPFRPNELIVKVERQLAALPRTRGHGDDLTLDPITLAARRGDRQSESLTPKEFQILALLHTTPGSTAARDDIHERLWPGVTVTAKTLEVHLANLRRKIAPLGLEIRHRPPQQYKLSQDGVREQVP